jgi:uncharacterized protein YndB with AHSA1/START domain
VTNESPGVCTADECSRSTSRQRRSGCGPRSSTRSSARYSFGVGTASEWTPGSTYRGAARGGAITINEGENLEVDPPHRLVQSYPALRDADLAAEGHAGHHVGDRAGGRLVPAHVTHDQLAERANAQLFGGWPMILCGLKAWLETGELLTTPGSLMYLG